MTFINNRLIPFLFIVSLLFSSAVTAQQSIPFGELSGEEIEMTQCSFDPDAEAIVLLDEASSNYDDSYHLITRHHVRIKILKEKGISNANIALHFWAKDDFEYIKVIQAKTFNPVPGKTMEVINVERKSIFTKKVNERIGEVAFTFPSVKTGSILEYEYESEMKSYGGLEDWYFQEERPVLLSKYNLVVVPNTEFTYRVIKRTDFNVVVTPKSSDGSVYFEMRNIPGLGNEAYMDSRKDYLQKIMFQLSAFKQNDGFGGNKYMTSWEEVNRELYGYQAFGGMMGKNIPGTDDFLKEVNTNNNAAVKMNLVYNYVRKNMNWNGGNSKYAQDGLKAAWQKKSGSSAEINFALVSLLKDAGLDVYPMLVSSRWHGKVDVSYPFVDQFNSVIACVKLNGRNYYLDATEKYTPDHIIPTDLLNTTGFIVNRKKGELINIANDSVFFREVVYTDVKIAADGTIEGTAKISSAEYARVNKLERYIDNKTGFLDDGFKKEKIPVEIRKFEVENTNNDSLPFQQYCEFTSRMGSTGDYGFVPLNLFSGFSENPFVGNKRFSNVNFGYSRSVQIITDITLPKEFAVEELPKNIRLVNPEKDIVMFRSVQYNKEDHKVMVAIRIDFSKSLYQADDYPVLQAFYKKMFEYLDEPLLLKKQ